MSISGNIFFCLKGALARVPTFSLLMTVANLSLFRSRMKQELTGFFILDFPSTLEILILCIGYAQKPQPVGDSIPHLFKYFCENLWLGCNWKLKSLPSQSLTWNLKMAPLNGRVLLETIISRFYIQPGECIWNHKFATTSAYPSYQAQPLISSPILPTPGQLCQVFSLTVWPIFSHSFKYPWWHLVGKNHLQVMNQTGKNSRNQDRIKDILWRVPEIAKEVDSVARDVDS